MSRLAALAVLLSPVAALAQTITVSTNAFGTNPVNLGLTACNNNQIVVVFWNLNATPNSSDVVKIFITKDTASCSASSDPTTAPTPALLQPTSAKTTDQATVTAQQLLLDLPNGCANTDHKATSPYTVYFCVRRTSGNLLNTGNLQMNFALVAPNPPSAPVATPGDSHLVLDWTSNDAGDNSYDVIAVPAGTPVDSSTPKTGNSVVTLHADIDHDSFGKPLLNDQAYDLYVRSTDAYGNKSQLSTAGSGTPVQIDDFYDRYRLKGGADEGGGGCASGGEVGLLATLGLVGVLRRRRAEFALVSAVLLGASPAVAADWTGLDRPPRRWLVGFKMDRYDPQIDTEAGLTGTPYHDIFHGRAPPRYQIEIDYQAFHPGGVGAVLLGGTVGYWQNHGKGLLHGTNNASQDDATLEVVPIGFIVTYRFDWLADRYRWLPVVPYVQAGLQTALWISRSGTGNVSTSSLGGRGSGWNYGYTTALGVALDVGTIDAGLAREAYISSGIQRTSFFAEYGWTRLDDFHKSGTLILNDRAWRFGISIEF